METNLLMAALQFAASFGGVVVALKFMNGRLDKLETSLSRAHDRISDHIHDHATRRV